MADLDLDLRRSRAPRGFEDIRGDWHKLSQISHGRGSTVKLHAGFEISTGAREADDVMVLHNARSPVPFETWLRAPPPPHLEWHHMKMGPRSRGPQNLGWQRRARLS